MGNAADNDARFRAARWEVFLALLANPAINEKLMYVATSTESVPAAAEKIAAAPHVHRLGDLAHFITKEARHYAGRST